MLCSTNRQPTKCQAHTFSGGHISSETLRDENWKEMFPFFSAPDQFPDYRSGGQWVALFFFSYICKCPVSASQHPTTCCDSWAFRKCPSVRMSSLSSPSSSSLLPSPTIFHDFSVTAPWKPKSLTTSSLVDFLRNSRHLWDEAMGPTVTDQGGVRQIWSSKCASLGENISYIVCF